MIFETGHFPVALACEGTGLQQLGLLHAHCVPLGAFGDTSYTMFHIEVPVLAATGVTK